MALIRGCKIFSSIKKTVRFYRQRNDEYAGLVSELENLEYCLSIDVILLPVTARFWRRQKSRKKENAEM